MRKIKAHAGMLVLLGTLAGPIRAEALDTEPTVIPATQAGATASSLPPASEPGERPTPGSADKSEDAPELMLFKDIPVVVAAGKREQTIQEVAGLHQRYYRRRC